MPTKRTPAKGKKRGKKAAKSPYQVLQFEILGREVEVGLDDKLKVSFVVERGGKRYGNAVVATSALPLDVVAAAFLLAANAADTISKFANEK